MPNCDPAAIRGKLLAVFCWLFSHSMLVIMCLSFFRSVFCSAYECLHTCGQSATLKEACPSPLISQQRGLSALMIIADWNVSARCTDLVYSKHFLSIAHTQYCWMGEVHVLFCQIITCYNYMFLRVGSPELTFFSTLASRCLKVLLSAGVQEPEPGAVPHWGPWPSILGGTTVYRMSGSFFSPANLGRGRSEGRHEAYFLFLFTMLD